MKSTHSLIEHIKQSEGFKPKAYKCPAGIWTCGYGHTRGVTAATSCTPSAAEEWLRQDLAPIEAHLSTISALDTQSKFDACADFCFNLGISNFNTSTLLRKIRQRAPEAEIRAEFMRWVYGGGKRLPGLVRRRQWEADRFFSR